MGKGDKKTRRGKLIKGSYGGSRPHKKTKPVIEEGKKKKKVIKKVKGKKKKK